MIELTNSYKVGDKIFATFKDAQIDALTCMFGGSVEIANALVSKKEEVLAILSMSEPVKRGRKPRSDQGKPHARKKAKAAVEELASPGIKVEGSGKYAGQ